MDFLIKAYWYQAEAAKKHIKVTDAQVQQAFQTAKNQQFPNASAFTTFLTQTGQTMQDILFRVRVNQVYKKLLAQHSGAVTQAQLQSYYKNHLSQFGSPQSRDLRIVRTNSPAQAQAAKAALLAGKSWQAVAKQYSVDTTTKSKGGLLTGVTKGQQEQALDAAAFAAPARKIEGPIHGTFGYYVFEVVKIKPSTQQSLAQALPLIRQILQSQSQQTAQSAVDNQAKKDWLQKTQCRSDYAMADCSGFKPPKTTATPTPSPGTATQAPTTAAPTTKTK
jgi:foldase protein PrsA